MCVSPTASCPEPEANAQLDLEELIARAGEHCSQPSTSAVSAEQLAKQAVIVKYLSVSLFLATSVVCGYIHVCGDSLMWSLSTVTVSFATLQLNVCGDICRCCFAKKYWRCCLFISDVTDTPTVHIFVCITYHVFFSGCCHFLWKDASSNSRPLSATRLQVWDWHHWGSGVLCCRPSVWLGCRVTGHSQDDHADVESWGERQIRRRRRLPQVVPAACRSGWPSGQVRTALYLCASFLYGSRGRTYHCNATV